MKNFWVACGVMAGFSQGGGVGLALSRWMVDGDPGADIWGMDVARYGDWTTLAYTNAKVRENYSRRFSIRFPNEELPAARPLRTTPIYEKLQAEARGVRRLLRPRASAVVRAHRRQKPRIRSASAAPTAHPHVAAECKAVQQCAWVCLEISNYGKFDMRGPGAAEWLSHMMANRVPAVGRIALTPMLNERGKLIGDFTMCRVAADHVFLDRHLCRRNLLHALVRAASCRRRAFRCGRARWSTSDCRSRARNSRALLQSLVRDDLSTAAFPFMSFRRMEIGMVPGYVGRVSFTGRFGLRDLGDHRLSARAL